MLNRPVAHSPLRILNLPFARNHNSLRLTRKSDCKPYIVILCRLRDVSFVCFRLTSCGSNNELVDQGSLGIILTIHQINLFSFHFLLSFRVFIRKRKAITNSDDSVHKIKKWKPASLFGKKCPASWDKNFLPSTQVARKHTEIRNILGARLKVRNRKEVTM